MILVSLPRYFTLKVFRKLQEATNIHFQKCRHRHVFQMSLSCPFVIHLIFFWDRNMTLSISTCRSCCSEWTCLRGDRRCSQDKRSRFRGQWHADTSETHSSKNANQKKWVWGLHAAMHENTEAQGRTRTHTHTHCTRPKPHYQKTSISNKRKTQSQQWKHCGGRDRLEREERGDGGLQVLWCVCVCRQTASRCWMMWHFPECNSSVCQQYGKGEREREE